jgi:hypothetical protein
VGVTLQQQRRLLISGVTADTLGMQKVFSHRKQPPYTEDSQLNCDGGIFRAFIR